jgi:hypothetical protein
MPGVDKSRRLVDNEGRNMRKIAFALSLIAVMSGCVRPHQGPIKTTIVTFPNHGVIEYNGHEMAREPVEVILPQDSNGRLTNRVVIRAISKDTTNLFSPTLILDPNSRKDPVPHKITVNMTLAEDGRDLVDMIQYDKWLEEQKELKHKKPNPKPTKPLGGY